MATIRIAITKTTEFVVDDFDNLCIERAGERNVPKDVVNIGFMTPHLIDQMIENLNRLRPFAK